MNRQVLDVSRMDSTADKRKELQCKLCTKRKDEQLVGGNGLGDRLEMVSLMFSAEDREMNWSVICTNRFDLPQPTPSRRRSALMATVFPRSWESLPIAWTSLTWSEAGGRSRPPSRGASLRMPAVAHDEWLPGQLQRGECREEDGHLRDVLCRRELAVDRLRWHDRLDDLFLGQAQFPGLLGDLPIDEGRTNEAGADHVGPDTVNSPFLGDQPGEPNQAVLGRQGALRGDASTWGLALSMR